MRRRELMEITDILQTKDYKSIVESVKYIENYLNLSGNYSKRILELLNENDLIDDSSGILDIIEKAIHNKYNRTDFEEDELFEERIDFYECFDIHEECSSYKKITRKSEFDLILEELADELDSCYEYNYNSALDHIRNIAFSKGIINAEISERTEIAESTISRIFNNKRKVANKEMAIKFCIGLDLDYSESREVLLKFGYTVDTDFKRDRIFKCCLERGHNIYDIQEVLIHFNEDGWL